MNDFNQTDSQGELFQTMRSEQQAQGAYITGGSQGKDKKQVSVGLDKFLIFILLVVIGIAIVYALGVEHGRRSVNRVVIYEEKPQSVVKANRVPPPLPPAKPEAPLIPVVTTVPVTSIPSTPSSDDAVPPPIDTAYTGAEKPLPKGAWTIQVVTYHKKEHAEAMMNRLRANGIEAHLIPSNEYLQVCAGFYESYDRAAEKVNLVRNISGCPDAYIRKVNR